jgi:hypothetical protein
VSAGYAIINPELYCDNNFSFMWRILTTPGLPDAAGTVPAPSRADAQRGQLHPHALRMRHGHVVTGIGS